ncbi:uncharacterized protein C11orf97 homolog isoform X4 [Phacochoerus africanus]|uniref:uncharacterized protein C11orf97 homolog isoform X4 n=1 Tax=Phacochoerus africanus TaxID=41426 RepID=UPI001FD9D7EB|nr:uncharacterized protein C11orf97 homolog isoform X4 [Phacochoerus africanus]
MRGEEAVTAGVVPEAGLDREPPPQPEGLGYGARGDPGGGGGGPQESRKQWKKFLYCEPHRRIKEVLEEELYIKRDECHVKNPPAGSRVLIRTWSKRDCGGATEMSKKWPWRGSGASKGISLWEA